MDVGVVGRGLLKSAFDWSAACRLSWHRHDIGVETEEGGNPPLRRKDGRNYPCRFFRIPDDGVASH